MTCHVCDANFDFAKELLVYWHNGAFCVKCPNCKAMILLPIERRL